MHGYNCFMHALLYKYLILLTVFGLVFSPPVVSGYISLQEADAAYLASDDIRAADRYERAAILLPWRSELWDQAGITRFRTKDYESAIRLLEIAKQKKTLSDVGWDVLGISYFQMGIWILPHKPGRAV